MGSSPPVHPRSRGEHAPIPEHTLPNLGSSPLARGTRRKVRRAGRRQRFIPARAGNTNSTAVHPSGNPVHPRSRGEHVSALAADPSSFGSSPLARGTREGWLPATDPSRFIPARAGNTDLRPRSRAPPPVHPRSRGEHSIWLRSAATSTGSSPLARGTRDREYAGDRHRRFIPARAGNTASTASLPSWTTVHPRSRGEHYPRVTSHGLADGSSPLARGTLLQRLPERRRHRFIPARAGNTPGAAAKSSGRAVHPRSRGEHLGYHLQAMPQTGSSPLARGTHPRRDTRGQLPRFIPARAGNTSSVPGPPRSPTVHPRSRGEHSSRAARMAGDTGSSPLARGTRHPHRLVRRGDRFIPARAGNTSCSSAGSAPAAVHPRSRGEHSGDRRSNSWTTGSSPLARGTLPPVRGALVHPRFIPARAGNTGRRHAGGLQVTVHPRSRGEHPRAVPQRRRRVGSSPLARGTPRDQPRRDPEPRFIPARAGNTPCSGSRRGRRPVHPRSRGEHQAEQIDAGLDDGSSPLARGTR